MSSPKLAAASPTALTSRSDIPAGARVCMYERTSWCLRPQSAASSAAVTGSREISSESMETRIPVTPFAAMVPRGRLARPPSLSGDSRSEPLLFGDSRVEPLLSLDVLHDHDLPGQIGPHRRVELPLIPGDPQSEHGAVAAG